MATELLRPQSRKWLKEVPQPPQRSLRVEQLGGAAAYPPTLGIYTYIYICIIYVYPPLVGYHQLPSSNKCGGYHPCGGLLRRPRLRRLSCINVASSTLRPFLPNHVSSTQLHQCGGFKRLRHVAKHYIMGPVAAVLPATTRVFFGGRAVDDTDPGPVRLPSTPSPWQRMLFFFFFSYATGVEVMLMPVLL